MSIDKPTLKSIQGIEDLDGVATAMGHVFQDAQHNLTSHRKLVVVLRNIQLRAIGLGYEDGFTLKFTKLINKILRLKKGEQVADRIAKFCSLFVATIQNEEAPRKEQADKIDSDSDSDDVEETPALKFVDYLIHHLLRGILSKDKNVRYRVVQLLAYLVNYITEIDADLFEALHFSLSRRLHDKEPIVRIQAIVAISRFQHFDIPDTEGLNSATERLIQALQHDDSPEVRRAALLNLVKNKSTLPLLLERARDTNSINRRLVFSRTVKEVQDFREIDVGLRENLLRWGLNDRDQSVQKAAIRMLSYQWYETVKEDLLELIDSMKVADTSIMDSAMSFFFESRDDKLEALEITKEHWKELTVERAFLIRAFYDHCNREKMYHTIDKNFPESIELAETLFKYLQLRIQILKSNSELVQKHKAYVHLVDKYERKLVAGQMEGIQLQSDINRIEELIADYQAQTRDLKAHIKLLRTKEKGTTTRKTTKDISALADDANERDVDEVMEELEQITEQLSDAKKYLKASKGLISDVQEKIAAIEKERESFLQSSEELEVEYGELADQLKDLEFIIEQLLLIAKDYDFSDEIGRRKMLQSIRSSLTDDELSDKLVEISLRVLRKISINERDFSTMSTEIITDIRDSVLDENDETFVSAVSIFQSNDDDEEIQGNPDDMMSEDGDNPSKKHKSEPKPPPDEILIQCLILLQHYLELAEDPLSNNYQFDSFIETLIRPAYRNEENKQIRLLGFRNFGLLSLLDRQLAINNLKFFGVAAVKAHDEELKVLCTKIVFDILSTHGVSILDESAENTESVDSLSLARLFYNLLRSYEMPSLQAVVAEGLCKLFLADLLNDFGKGKLDDSKSEGAEEIDQEKQLLEALVLSYFHPLNAVNHELKQILAFCLPVYAFSHSSHQQKLTEISGDCFYRIFREDGDFARNGSTTATPLVVIQQLIHWCDPNNVVKVDPLEARKSATHFWLAINFLQVIEQDSPKSVKRSIIVNLGKLCITEDLGSTVLKGLQSAIEETKDLIAANRDDPEFVFDGFTERTFDKFQVSILELVTKAEEEEEKRRQESDKSAVSSRNVSRAQTPVHQKEESQEEEDSRGAVKGEGEVEQDGMEEDEEERAGEMERQAEQSTEEADDPEERFHEAEDGVEDISQPQKSDENQQAELAEIDRLLDDEDNVQYDVDVSLESEEE